ncbi:MAG: HAD hydrolase-like protein [Candidatus Kapabacteria bacterium]|nr:HAD hydrolase-like protein [Candidatus Kapabacteria bacterium]
MDSYPNILYNREIRSHKDSSQKSTTKKLILFDIDSTLISVKAGIPQDLVAESFETIFGLRPTAELKGGFAGKTDLQILIELGETIGLNREDVMHQQQSIIRELSRRSAMTFSKETIEILPGVMELLKSIALNPQCVLGLVTGNNESCAYLKLKPYGLDTFFRVGAFGCEHEQRNRLPVMAIDRAKDMYPHYLFEPESAWIIGDSPADVRCAIANTMQCLGVATGNYTAEELKACGAYYIVENFEDYENVVTLLLQ